jgi:hypothetical protein
MIDEAGGACSMNGRENAYNLLEGNLKERY